jgi:peptide/nickel transport system substrate-binding protein
VGIQPTGRVRAVLLVGALIAVVAMLATAAAVAFSDDDVASPPPSTIPAGGTLRLGLVASSFPVDPATSVVTDVGAVMLDDLLWGRLTATDPTTSEPVPALAESWEASPDLTRFTFRLRPGASFSDGTPLTSTDVAATLARVAALGASSLAGDRLSTVRGYAEVASGSIAGVTTPDPATVVIELGEPVADLPALLAAPSFGVVPAAVSRGERPLLPGPTSGPYAVASQASDLLTLRRADATSPDAARPEVVEVHRFDSETAAGDLYDAGGLDLLPLPADRAAELVAPGVGAVEVSPSSALWWIAADTTDPVLASAELRRGIARAADRPAIVTAALPGRRLLDGLVPPEVPGGAPDACGERCTTDPGATSVAVAAAFPSGAPTVRLDTPSSPGPAQVASDVSSALSAAGLPTTVRTRSVAEYRDQVLVADRQLFWFGWVGVAATPEAYLPALFLTGSPGNVTGLADPAVDAAIRAARSTADPAERATRWAEVESLVLDRMPVVPLAQGQYAVAVASTVQGFEQRLDGTFAIDRLWLAPVPAPAPAEAPGESTP